jgi:AraC-like DNA-binding protein/quercetin dioxygenase-like cupin family protein
MMEEKEYWRGWEGLSPVLIGGNFWDGAPGLRVGPRYIEEFQFIYVQGGMAEAFVGEEKRLIRAGDLMFYGPNVRHGFTGLGPETLRLVGLRLVFLQEDVVRVPTGRHTSHEPFVHPLGEPRCPLEPMPWTFVSSPPGSPIGRLCESLALSQLAGEGGRLMEKRGLLFMLLDAVFDAQNQARVEKALPEHQRLAVQRAQRVILSSLAVEPDVEALAGQAGWSRDHFARLFRAQTGFTVAGYVRQQRLLEARRLLIEGRLTVGEVARAVGFEDPLYFSRAFSRVFRMPPSELRKYRQIG